MCPQHQLVHLDTRRLPLSVSSSRKLSHPFTSRIAIRKCYLPSLPGSVKKAGQVQLGSLSPTAMPLRVGPHSPPEAFLTPTQLAWHSAGNVNQTGSGRHKQHHKMKGWRQAGRQAGEAGNSGAVETQEHGLKVNIGIICCNTAITIRQGTTDVQGISRLHYHLPRQMTTSGVSGGDLPLGYVLLLVPQMGE
jgi:hypothetical protein